MDDLAIFEVGDMVKLTHLRSDMFNGAHVPNRILNVIHTTKVDEVEDRDRLLVGMCGVVLEYARGALGIDRIFYKVLFEKFFVLVGASEIRLIRRAGAKDDSEMNLVNRINAMNDKICAMEEKERYLNERIAMLDDMRHRGGYTSDRIILDDRTAKWNDPNIQFVPCGTAAPAGSTPMTISHSSLQDERNEMRRLLEKAFEAEICRAP